MNNSTNKILVTGGAGYIGSHVCNLLIDNDYDVTVIDNLVTGNKFLVPRQAKLEICDIADEEKVNKIINENNFNHIHQRIIKIDKRNSNLFGEDKLISADGNKKLQNIYSIRFHLYPGINAVQTMSKNSILIQVNKNKSLIFTTSADNLILEKSIFLGRNQIVNNFCITISGTLNSNKNKNIIWELKRNN